MQHRHWAYYGLGLTLLLMIALMAWNAIFFTLMGLPVELSRFWAIGVVALHTFEFDGVTNIALWLFPVCIGGLLIVMRLAPYLKPAWQTLYGNAHWATKSEIKKMGLLANEGIIVGNYQGHLLRYQLTNHMLVFAPSRSGKGVSVAVPNALTWQGSLVAIDIKNELFDITSGYRQDQLKQAIYRFSPADEHFQTHCINPLDYVNKDQYRCIADLQLILDILIESQGEDNKMWTEEARSLALGLLLYLMDSDRPFTLGEFSAIVKGETDLAVYIKELLTNCTIADNLITLHPAAYLTLNSFVQKAEKEQSGVRSTITGMLRLWEDPLINAATSRSDFDLRTLRKKPFTLYLSVGVDQVNRLAPIFNLIVQVFLNQISRHLPKAGEPHKVLCLLDEFSQLGRMTQLKNSFGYLAGFGVHLMPIIQNVGQFYDTYGGRDASDVFFQNTDLKIAFRQNTDTDKELVSRQLGNKTVRVQTKSYGSSRTNIQYTESYQERPLLDPHEVGRLCAKKQLIITGDGVVCCRKVRYYQDKQLKKRCLKPIAVPTIKPHFPMIKIKKNDAKKISQVPVSASA